MSGGRNPLDHSRPDCLPAHRGKERLLPFAFTALFVTIASFEAVHRPPFSEATIPAPRVFSRWHLPPPYNSLSAATAFPLSLAAIPDDSIRRPDRRPLVARASKHRICDVSELPLGLATARLLRMALRVSRPPRHNLTLCGSVGPSLSRRCARASCHRHVCDS